MLKSKSSLFPYDSINTDIRIEVEGRFRELEKKGAIFHFDKWNVGDPNRTTTAVGRWYSFHGKFIITEKSAIVLSANLTDAKELDALIIFKDDQARIKEFNARFDELIKTFITSDSSNDGTIKRQIVAVDTNPVIFQLPKNIPELHKDHWIRHYPVTLCPKGVAIQDKLYLTPFDARGREVYEKLIKDANEYAYMSAESFTDEDFSAFLVNIAVNKGIEIKILVEQQVWTSLTVSRICIVTF